MKLNKTQTINQYIKILSIKLPTKLLSELNKQKQSLTQRNKDIIVKLLTTVDRTTINCMRTHVLFKS